MVPIKIWLIKKGIEIMFERIKKRLAEQKDIALASHVVGVQGIVLAIATYAATNPEQMQSLLGEKWGAILLGVAGLVSTIARVWNAKPGVPTVE